MSQSEEPRPASPTSASYLDTAAWAIAHPLRDLTGVTLGDYQVERLLGRGGMGEVYLARQTSLNRPVALKVLRPELLAKQNYLSRFEAEATAVAKLNHPNIVHIYALGLEDGVRFISMEYVPGTNLRDYVTKKGALDYPLALSIMRQAAVGVGVAGELGLIHRDIKPENLLLTKKGQVKIADFGLCRDLDASPLDLTQPGVTMGTPAYMSPEQAQGLAVDHRSDLYSLGATFYYMLTGMTPFRGETALVVALKHVREVPPSISVHRPDIPAELERLVMKLLAKAPADRYQTAAELLRDIARVREAMHAPSGLQPMNDLPGITATSLPAAGVLAVSPSAITTSQTSPADPSPATRFGVGSKIGILAASTLLGAVFGWVQRPADLLFAAEPAGAGKSRSMPGLWIDRNWERIPKAATPEAQFHYAQLRAPLEQREAAWLAVSGHWPTSREWAARSYTQLARHLLTRNDADRLQILAGEIESWEGAQTREKELAEVIRAGVYALNDDLEGVIEAFNSKANPQNLSDPALLELGLEAIDEAEEIANRPNVEAKYKLARDSLQKIRQSLLSKLMQSERAGGVLRRNGPKNNGAASKRALPKTGDSDASSTSPAP